LLRRVLTPVGAWAGRVENRCPGMVQDATGIPLAVLSATRIMLPLTPEPERRVDCSLGGEQGGGERCSRRVTTVFRREDSEWRVVHRHGDSLNSRSGAGLAQLLQASDR